MAGLNCLKDKVNERKESDINLILHLTGMRLIDCCAWKSNIEGLFVVLSTNLYYNTTFLYSTDLNKGDGLAVDKIRLLCVFYTQCTQISYAVFTQIPHSVLGW